LGDPFGFLFPTDAASLREVTTFNFPDRGSSVTPNADSTEIESLREGMARGQPEADSTTKTETDQDLLVYMKLRKFSEAFSGFTFLLPGLLRRGEGQMNTISTESLKVAKRRISSAVIAFGGYVQRKK